MDLSAQERMVTVKKAIYHAGLVILISMALMAPLLGQDAQSLVNQGLQFAQKQMWDKAIEAFQRAIALNPQNPMAHNNLGYVYAEKGFFKEAFQEYEIALKIKPDYKEAQQNLLAGASQWSQDLIDHGQYSTAVELLKGAIARFPAAGELYYFLGVAYQAQDRFQDALQYWKKAAQIKPESSTAFYVKAIEKLMAQNVPGAIADLNAAIKVMPQNAYAHNMLGILYVQMGKLAEAKTEFGQALRYKPNYVEPYLNLAYLAEKEGQQEEALKNYKAATIKNPYSVKGLMAMGKIYFTTGRFFDAESCYSRALRIQPLSPDLHSSLAFTLARQNKHADAIREFETALSINPKSVDASYALGLIYRSLKGDEYKAKAIEAFQRCMAIDSSHKYSQMAAQKLAEMGGGATPLPTATGAPPSVAAIQAESPDGDLTLSITPQWQEIPLQGEGSDKFLWIFSRPDMGLVLTVYKPQGVPVNNVDTIKPYSIKEAEKKGLKKQNEEKARVGGLDGYKIQFADSEGKSRYMYIAVKNKKAYVFMVEAKDSALLPEVEGLIMSSTIR
ncbi:MAG: tetratricopeptide repeat protein [Candidatus Eremiobacteraeota bacterium]|nr:tetratricopeptide repeat protein [Candidatus Eremiobacteraeota bacterium]